MNMGRFVGIVGEIVQHLPFAISMVERFLGGNNGAAKKVAAAKEVIEFVTEISERNPDDEWNDVNGLELQGLLAALEDEEVFTDKIMAVNDSIVELVNYINSKTPTE
jgi:hypothetical protein